MFRHLGLFVLAICGVAAILVLEKVLGGLSRDVYFALGCIPWVLVITGGFIADENARVRGRLAGHLVEVAGLTLQLFLLGLGAALASRRPPDGDDGFIRWGLQLGLSLAASWLCFRLGRGLGAAPRDPLEAAADWRRGTGGPLGRLRSAATVIGDGPLFTILFGALFCIASLLLLAIGAGGPAERPRWVGTALFFGAAAVVGVTTARQRWRELVGGADP